MEEKIVETAKIEVNSKKCVGVYDKKLLWRAQLYVDEGADDWNDVNRWTAAQGNVWDTVGNGTQCDIQSWTQTSGTTRHNTIAYTHYGKDSVADFNSDMLAQRDAMTQIYNANHEQWPNWYNTTAPGNNWNNYIDYLNTTIPIGTGAGEYQPFRPLYSTSTGASSDAGYSAGTECIGFTQQALSYANNIYEHPSITHTQTWGNASPGDTYVYPNSTYGWLIWQYDELLISPDEMLQFIIPGDMICMRNHAVIVDRIDYRNNTTQKEVDGYGGIKLIEAGGVPWYVNKGRTLEELTENGLYFTGDHKIAIYRLKTIQ